MSLLSSSVKVGALLSHHERHAVLCCSMRRALPVVVGSSAAVDVCWFSSSSSSKGGFGGKNQKKKGNSNNFSFRVRRRPSKQYRPMKARGSVPKWNDPDKGHPSGNYKFEKPQDRIIDLSKNNIMSEDAWGGETESYADDSLDKKFGSLAADVIRHTWREKEYYANDDDDDDNNNNTDQTDGGRTSVQNLYDVETQLRMADYFTSEVGSTEDLVGERKFLAMEIWNEKKRKQFLKDIDKRISEQSTTALQLEKTEKVPDDSKPDDDESNEEQPFDPSLQINPNQKAFGPWGEMIIRVDRVIKLWRGGRLESYRALVIGGNLNGCGGFGVGKAFDPLAAVEAASRKCKRNIFFVERYQNNGLTRDLVGKQNSCRVTLRTTTTGLRGNPLCMEILKRFGITNCVAKSHGNRNQFNVVRATFKALLTHETLDDIALKRGKRLVSLERTKRLGI